MTCAQQIESLADKTSTDRADTDRADTDRTDTDRADTDWADRQNMLAQEAPGVQLLFAHILRR